MTNNPSCVASKKPIPIEKDKIARLSTVCTDIKKKILEDFVCFTCLFLKKRSYDISLTFNYIVGY